MGRAVMEPKILQEKHQYLSHFIEHNEGKPIDISHSLSQGTCNVMSQLLYGRRFEYDDEKFNTMIASLDEQLELCKNYSRTANSISKQFLTILRLPLSHKLINIHSRACTIFS